MTTLTATQAANLKASGRRLSFRYEVLDPSGDVKGEAYIIGASIENNDLADKSKRTAQFAISKDTDINFMQDRIKAYATVQGNIATGGWLTASEWPCGVFYLDVGGNRWNNASKDNTVATGYDGLVVLAEDKVLDRYVAASGALYHTIIEQLVADAGFPDVQVEYTSLTLPAAKEWEPGTPKLTIVNNLLDAINYRSLYMDADGVPRSEPYLSPDSAPVVWTYEISKDSVILPGIDVTLDLFDVPNAWVATISEPDRPVLTSRYVNDDPNSILSTVYRGRTVVEVLGNMFDGEEGGIEAATQAILDAKVAAMAAEASQQYIIAEFTTALMPFHGTGDVVILDYGEGGAKYRSHTWSMNMVAGGQMRHEFRRVVTL